MADVFVGKGVTDLGTLTIGNNDTIIFGEGTQFVNVGLTLTATGLTIEARPGFGGRIGGDGAGGLKPTNAAAIDWNAGGGEFNLDVAAIASTVNVTSVGPHRTNITGAGAVNILDTANEFISVASEVVVTTHFQRGGSGVMRHNSTDVADVWLADGASLVLGRGLSGTARINGRLMVRREDSLASASQPIFAGAVIELADGLFGFEGNTSTGTMALNAVGGAIDFSKALSNFTVVAAILPASVKRRSKLKSRHATVTITTETEFGGDSTLDVAD